MELTTPQALLLLFLVFLLLSAVLFPSPFASMLPQQSVHKPADDVQCLDPLKVYVVELPREFNYGLLEHYYKSRGGRDLWLGEEGDDPVHDLPYPRNPNWRQYSAEYWLLADMSTEEPLRAAHSAAVRVHTSAEADVLLVPFFCALSAEIQLGERRGRFRKKVEENKDYVRQRRVMELLMQTPEWQRSGGRDHVFMLTGDRETMFSCSQVSKQGHVSSCWTYPSYADPMAMWHVRGQIARSILLVVDFGGWYMEDAKAGEKANVIAHTGVSLTKDVIVPYTHLLPTLTLAEASSPSLDVLLYLVVVSDRDRERKTVDDSWE